jgi:hypothetical protein
MPAITTARETATRDTTAAPRRRPANDAPSRPVEVAWTIS